MAHRQDPTESRLAIVAGCVVLAVVVLLALSPLFPGLLWIALYVGVVVVVLVLVAAGARVAIRNRNNGRH